jgi:hypothetical protein
MNKVIAFILLIAVDAVIGQAHYFILHEDTYGASLLIQQFFLAAFIFCLIDYKYIVLKTISFVFMLSEVGDVVQYLSLDSNGIAPFVSVMLFVPWLIYAIYRTYDVESAEPQPDMIYKVAHKPDDFTSFICSLIFEKPTSGSGVLLNNVLYIYRHGEFSKIDFNRLPKERVIIMETGFHKDDRTIKYLQSMLGHAWMPWSNCITMQVKLRWMHRARKG